MQAEEPVGIGPGFDRSPAGGAGKRLELRYRVFVGVLGVDALAAREAEIAPEHTHALVGEAHDIDLDAARILVVDRLVRETQQVEIAIELPVDAGKQVEIKGGGDAA